MQYTARNSLRVSSARNYSTANTVCISYICLHTNHVCCSALQSKTPGDLVAGTKLLRLLLRQQAPCSLVQCALSLGDPLSVAAAAGMIGAYTPHVLIICLPRESQNIGYWATSSGLHLLLLRGLLACSSLLAILAASLLASAWERRELGLVLDGEVAPASHLRLVQLREIGVGRLAQGPQASAASSVAIRERPSALPAYRHWNTITSWERWVWQQD